MMVFNDQTNCNVLSCSLLKKPSRGLNYLHIFAILFVLFHHSRNIPWHTRFNNSQFFEKILFSQSKASLKIDPTFVDKKIGLHTTTFAILITKWSLLEFFFSTNVFFSGKFLTRLLWQMFKNFLNNMVWIMFEHIFLAGLKKVCIWNCMVMQIYFKNHAFYHTFWIKFSTEIKHFKHSLHPCIWKNKTKTYYLLAP